MNKHKEHNVLGSYCWTCQKPTKAGIPGWPKASHNDGPREADMVTTLVIWADGTEDTSRECALCKTSSCKYPVHEEEYSTAVMGLKVAGTMSIELEDFNQDETN